MFPVADKYDIAALGELAKRKFEESIKKATLDNDLFLEVIQYVYSTTPESNRGLRDVIVRQTQTRGRKTMADAALRFRLQGIVAETPQFAWDLFQSSVLAAEVKEPSVFGTPERKTKLSGELLSLISST